MLSENKSAETAAYEVGYDSPAQFNREYKRQFGEPPRRDVKHLRTSEVLTREEG
jgi:AraC-like DNA-binding protein